VIHTACSRCVFVLSSLVLLWISVGFALDTRGPYLTDLTKDRAVLVFHTDKDVEALLEYRAERGRDNSFEQQSQIGRHHMFYLRDLVPAERYAYRVLTRQEGQGAPGNPTDWYFFATPSANPEEVSFIVYGDSRDASPSPKRHGKVTSHFLKHKSEFVISTGDLLLGGPEGSSSVFGSDWTDNFFGPLQGVFQRLPYYLVVGNHDQDAPESAKALQTVFPVFAKAFHHSFQLGNIHFVILHVANQMKEFQRQKRWFVEEMNKARNADWRVVLLHVSPFTNGKYRNSSWTLEGREEFLRACVQNKVDLVLSGHDHSYQRFLPLKTTESDTHAVLFVVTALAGTNPYRAYEDQYSAKIVNDTDHFCVVGANRHQLKLTAYDSENRPFDQAVLVKGKNNPGKIWKPVPLN